MVHVRQSKLQKIKDFDGLTELDLLNLYASVISELKSRKVVRTQNNPIGDYTEWLVADRLNLTLAENSAAGYDAVNRKGIRFQIKGRRVTPRNSSRQLSAIRKLESKDFDFLIGVIFDSDFKIIEAVRVPHKIIGKYAKYSKHQNAHILHLKGDILNDPEVKGIPELRSK